jgi:hypothetical protein
MTSMTARLLTYSLFFHVVEGSFMFDAGGPVTVHVTSVPRVVTKPRRPQDKTCWGSGQQGNRKVQWHDVHTKFFQNRSKDSNVFVKQRNTHIAQGHDDIQGVPFNVESATTACRSINGRTIGKWVNHNAEHIRRMLVSGFRVTWDTL